MVELSSEQLNAAEQGEAVRIVAGGKTFVLLSQTAYDDELDFSPWSQQEIELLADEAAKYVTGDGLDEVAES